jgi:hypothetical protein
VEGAVDGVTDGAVDGAADGAVDGDADGAVDGDADGAVDGVIDGAWDGVRDGDVEGDAEGDRVHVPQLSRQKCAHVSVLGSGPRKEYCGTIFSQLPGSFFMCVAQ